MRKRPHDAAKGGILKNDVGDSMFAPEKHKLPPIPRDLPKDVRASVRAILKQNRHLTVRQVPIVVRYVRLQNRFDEVEEILLKEDLVEDGLHGQRAHPLIAIQLSISSRMGTLERALSLTVGTTRELLTKEEQKPEAPPELKIPDLKVA